MYVHLAVSAGQSRYLQLSAFYFWATLILSGLPSHFYPKGNLLNLIF